MKINGIIAICILVPALLFSQIENSFKKYLLKDGLSETSIFTIYQDSWGYMWFGTTFGLNKFDGYDFTNYLFDPTDPTSLSDNIITGVLEDQEHRLWVSTSDGGLNLFDRWGDSFIRYKHHSTDSTTFYESVECMTLDPSGNLWTGSRNGLERVDIENQSFIRHPLWEEISKPLGQVEITALLFKNENDLFVGTLEHGLFELDIKNHKYKSFLNPNSSISGMSHNRVMDLILDDQERLWIATYGGGLNLLENGQFKNFKKTRNNPNSITNDNLFKLFVQDSTLFIGTEGGGLNFINLFQFDTTHPIFQSIQHDINKLNSLSSNNVRSVFVDEQQNIWIGTFKAGLNFRSKNGNKFKHYNSQPGSKTSLSNNLVNCIFQDSKDNIWIGTDGGGLNLFDPKNETFKIYRKDPKNPSSLAGDNVLSIVEDKDGFLWLGTWNAGLEQFDPQTETFRHFGHKYIFSSPSLNNLHHITLDHKGMLWLGTYHGLETFNIKNSSYRTISSPLLDYSPLISNWIIGVMEDHNYNMWVATRKGLDFLSKENRDKGHYAFKHYLHQNYDPADPRPKMVHSIFETSNHDIYALTKDGLFQYQAKQDTFFLFTTKDGLPSNGVFRMLEDNDGFLWISTTQGLVRFSQENKTFETFDKSDGLQEKEFAMSALKSKSGELYFGGGDGFNVFDPKTITKNKIPPPVVITKLMIYNHATPFKAVQLPATNNGPTLPDIVIHPDQNVFSIEFAALDYTNPSKNEYLYKMEGLDKNWIKTDADNRIAFYRNLPGGKYTFRVIASNADKVWNENGSSINIQIIPPFWKSNTALLLYILIILLILYSLRKIIITKAQYDAELHLDHLKLDFFKKISHEFRTPLTLIIGPLEKFIKNPVNAQTQNYYLQLMLRNSRRLLRLVNQFLDIQKLDSGQMSLSVSQIDANKFVQEIVDSFHYWAESKNINMFIQHQTKPVQLLADEEKLDKIFYNLLSNALKFTPEGGQVKVSIETFPSLKQLCEHFHYDKKQPASKLKTTNWVDKTIVKFSVKDTGSGIAENKLSHIFELFYQEDSEATNQGTGIGLALTKDLVELHGGIIYVNSQQNHGTEFNILLPVNGLKGQDNSTVSPKEHYHSEIHKEAILEKPEAEPNPLQSDAPLLLIVEDDTDLRSFIKQHFSSQYRIIEAPNGTDGLHAAFENFPDLIISDVMMPGMNGFELCNKIKENQQTSHIPVILLTARTEVTAQMQGFQMGADAYIQKPFDPEMLSLRVQNIFKNRQRLQERFKKELTIVPSTITVTPIDQQLLEKAIEIVEEHMADETFSVEDLAFKLGLSRAQLYRKLDAITGFSPREFIQNLRLKRAAQLISQSAGSISEISYQTGFSDPAYFSNSFKKQFGVSPSRFGKK